MEDLRIILGCFENRTPGSPDSKICNVNFFVKRHILKLFKRRSRLDVRKYVFGNSVTDKWNNLSQCCINYTTLNNFKSPLGFQLFLFSRTGRFQLWYCVLGVSWPLASF